MHRNIKWGSLVLPLLLLFRCTKAAPIKTTTPEAKVQILITPSTIFEPVTYTPSPTTEPRSTITPTTTIPGRTFFNPPTPTVFHNLLHHVSDEQFSLSDELTMDIYTTANGPFPDEGYDPFIRSLGEQSQLRSLTQGRYSWDTADLALMEKDNASLAPFGYHLESQPVSTSSGARRFTLYKGDQIILDPIIMLGQVSVNQSGTDFLLLVQGETQFQLVRKGSVELWSHINGWIANSSPQFLGDDILYVERRNGPSAEVFRGKEVIYTRQFDDRPGGSGLIGFWTYDNHWVLETINHVVIDGKDVNVLNGYDKSYEFHLLGGKPLFFFEKSGKVGVSFDSQTAFLPFQSIPHYGCCSAALNNPLQIGNILIFYGAQGEGWFYVEMTMK